MLGFRQFRYVATGVFQSEKLATARQGNRIIEARQGSPLATNPTTRSRKIQRISSRHSCWPPNREKVAKYYGTRDPAQLDDLSPVTHIDADSVPTR
jgi:hypothetical protein